MEAPQGVQTQKHTTDSIQDWGEATRQEKTNTTCQKPKKHSQRMKKDPSKHFNSTDAERSKTKLRKGRERKCSGAEQKRIDTTDQLQPKTTTGKDFTQGSEAVSPRQDTCITHTHTHTHTHKAFSFLPPPFVSSQGFQLKWGGSANSPTSTTGPRMHH